MWSEGPVIFEGEDEAALKRRFVELCAKYPDRNFFEIGEYTFVGLKDASVRGQQAAMVWSKELSVLDAIDEAKRKGVGGDGEEVTREILAAEVLALARDPKTDRKERLNGYKLVAEMHGLIVKVTDNTNRDNEPRPVPNFVIAQYDD